MSSFFWMGWPKPPPPTPRDRIQTWAVLIVSGIIGYGACYVFYRGAVAIYEDLGSPKISIEVTKD